MSWTIYDPEEAEHQAVLRRERFTSNTYLRTPEQRAQADRMGVAMREYYEQLATHFDMSPVDYFRAKREAL